MSGCSSYLEICLFLSWQESAYEKSQKYKEGKFILEREKMIDGDQVGSDGDDE
jgi:hypothetical protein